MFCFDTNIVVDILRGDSITLAKLEVFNTLEICITPIIASELYEGCYKSNRMEKALVLVEDFISTATFLDFNIKSCKLYGQIYKFLQSKGKLTEEKDLMIAAICISHNATLITKNKKHFQNIPGLKVEYV